MEKETETTREVEELPDGMARVVWNRVRCIGMVKDFGCTSLPQLLVSNSSLNSGSQPHAIGVSENTSVTT